LSLLEREWGPKNLLSCAYQWIEWNDAFEEQVVGISPERVHRLSYEALMADVKGEAEAIYDFIGEPMPEAHVRRIAEHVLGGNTNKWKSHLSERQLRRFDGLAVNALNRYGYECSPDALRPSSATLLASRIHNLFGRFLYLIKLNTLDELRIRFLGKEPFAD
jgi:hypothetical protein